MYVVSEARMKVRSFPALAAAALLCAMPWPMDPARANPVPAPVACPSCEKSDPGPPAVRIGSAGPATLPPGPEDRPPGLLPGADAPRPRGRRWRRDPEVASLLARARDMNILLVVVDALRAEPLGDPATLARLPNIAALRQRARWFTNTFAPAAGTDLCMGGLLTGSLDPMSGADFTLPEILSAAGLRSHAVLPREVVRATSKTMLTRGLRGHDILVTDPGKPNVPQGVSSYRTTNLGLSFIDRWLDGASPERSGPFFLWLHYFDLHEHHQFPANLPAIASQNEGRAARDSAEKYAALLGITDAALGRLFEGIASRGLADDTIVVFASDHGESLQEDPRLPENHGRVLYNPLVHVPLAIAIPGLEGGDDPRPASLLDVPITLLDLLGLRVPPSMDAGRSLLPSLVKVPLDEQPRTLVLNETDQFAVIQWPFKVLVQRKTAAAELYDLSRDFTESVNLAPTLPDVVQALSRAYRAHPAINLDRTRAGRRRFEELARMTRPGRVDLARMAARRALPRIRKR